MTIVNPDHLLELARLLLNATPGRKPRQANLRRAVSTAYYAVFHCLLIAAADELVGKSQRGEKRYALVYRSIDHSAIRRVCDEASRQKPTLKYRRFIPAGGLDQKIRGFSNIFLRLQTLRHEADYDPVQYFSSVDVLYSIYLASSAIEEFAKANSEDRKIFLTLLLFPPR